MQELPAIVQDMTHITTQEAITGNVLALKGRGRVTDEALGEAIGLSRAAVNDRLNLKAKWQIEEVLRAAAFFGVDVVDLFAPAKAVQAS